MRGGFCGSVVPWMTNLAATIVIAEQGVFVAALVRIVAVFDPLLLDEFELAEDAGVQHHEDDAAFVVVAHRLAFGHILAVGKAAAADAAAVDELAVEAEGVARIDAADVRADGAAGAIGIAAVSEVRIAVGVGDEGRVGGIRREFDAGCRRASGRRTWRRVFPCRRRSGGSVRRGRRGKWRRFRAACGRP